MSFAVETLLWMIRVFLLYFAAVFLPPAFVLRPVLRGKPFSQCFLICAVSGHFYLAFATELLALVHLTWGPALLLALPPPVLAGGRMSLTGSRSARAPAGLPSRACACCAARSACGSA